MYESGQNNTRILISHLLNMLVILVGVGSASSDDKLFVRIQLVERLDKVMHAFLGNNTPEKQYIVVLVKTIFFGNFLRRNRLTIFNAIGNEMCTATIFFLKILPHAFAEHYDFIRAFRCGTFSELEICGGELAPFGTLPVKTVNGRYRAHARPMRQTQHDAGTFGMIVDHVRPGRNGFQCREE